MIDDFPRIGHFALIMRPRNCGICLTVGHLAIPREIHMAPFRTERLPNSVSRRNRTPDMEDGLEVSRCPP